jgi:tetratricopeptide (TPR) repeat protein
MAARAVLIRAREINPLNTDHSANLARLYRRWADLAQTPEDKKSRGNQSSIYYQDATNLSPNNAVLWNEWATVLLLNGDVEGAKQKLARSLELDNRFEQTYLIMGDLYMQLKDLDKAAEAYSGTLKINPKQTQARNVLCYIYAQQNKLDEAIACNQEIVTTNPSDWNALKNMAILYDQKGNLTEALRYARIAFTIAPTTQQPALNGYIAQIQQRLAQPPAPVVTATQPTTP